VSELEVYRPAQHIICQFGDGFFRQCTHQQIIMEQKV